MICYDMIWYDMTYYTRLYYTILCYTILYYTILFYTVDTTIYYKWVPICHLAVLSESLGRGVRVFRVEVCGRFRICDIRSWDSWVSISGESTQHCVQDLYGPPTDFKFGLGWSWCCFGTTETMLAETMMADLRARAARVYLCKCTGCKCTWLHRSSSAVQFRGNHSSNTTCLRHVFFKRGE